MKIKRLNYVAKVSYFIFQSVQELMNGSVHIISMHAVVLSGHCMQCRCKINEQIFHKIKSTRASGKKINSTVARDIENRRCTRLVRSLAWKFLRTQISCNQLMRILEFNANTVIPYAVHFIG